MSRTIRMPMIEPLITEAHALRSESGPYVLAVLHSSGMNGQVVATPAKMTPDQARSLVTQLNQAIESAERLYLPSAPSFA